MPGRDIIEAISTIRVLSPRTYSFNGRAPVQAPETDEFATLHNSSPLAVDIANALYFNCYAVPFDGKKFRTWHEFLPPADKFFQRELSSANQSRDAFRPSP